MRENVDIALGLQDGLGPDAKSRIKERIGKAIAILTAILAITLTFLEVGLPELSLKSFTTEAIVMLISAYIIYFSLEESGEEAGRRTEGHAAAREEYRGVRERISGDMISPLREFCLDYTRAELEYRRRCALISEDITEEEYKAYKEGRPTDEKKKRSIRKIEAMRPLRLEARMLLEGERRAKSEFSPPEGQRLARLVVGLIPLTLGTLFTVSMIITAKDGLSLVGALESLIRLGCLPIIALKGYIEGYKYSTETECAWYKTRAAMLSSFLNGYGERQKADK